MVEKIKDYICEFLNIDSSSIDENTNFKTGMTLDSLTLIGLIVALENEFDIEINEEELKNLETVGDLMAYIQNKEK